MRIDESGQGRTDNVINLLKIEILFVLKFAHCNTFHSTPQLNDLIN